MTIKTELVVVSYIAVKNTDDDGNVTVTNLSDKPQFTPIDQNELLTSHMTGRAWMSKHEDYYKSNNLQHRKKVK